MNEPDVAPLLNSSTASTHADFMEGEPRSRPLGMSLSWPICERRSATLCEVGLCQALVKLYCTFGERVKHAVDGGLSATKHTRTRYWSTCSQISNEYNTGRKRKAKIVTKSYLGKAGGRYRSSIEASITETR